MATDLFGAKLKDIKDELEISLIECTKRGLLHCAKWLAEIKSGLDPDKLKEEQANSSSSKPPIQEVFLSNIADNERDDYQLAKCYFDIREYDRSAYFIRNAESPVPRFLHLYATYMAKEKRRLDNTTDATNIVEFGQNKDQSDMLVILKNLYNQRKLDGFGLYLYGVVLKRLDLKEMAASVLVEAIGAIPTLWSAYVELSPLITNLEHYKSLNLPNHWMKTIFLAQLNIELFFNFEGLEMFEKLQQIGFKNSTYIMAQIALVYHNNRSKNIYLRFFLVLSHLLIDILFFINFQRLKKQFNHFKNCKKSIHIV